MAGLGGEGDGDEPLDGGADGAADLSRWVHYEWVPVRVPLSARIRFLFRGCWVRNAWRLELVPARGSDVALEAEAFLAGWNAGGEVSEEPD